jgi:hypothetical protein
VSGAWPPPPDLASIQELMRSTDPEGLLAQGCPADEYEPEERAFFTAIADFPTPSIVVLNLLPILEAIWRQSFSPDANALAKSRPQLTLLAQQVERFFGPAAQPQTRGAVAP